MLMTHSYGFEVSGNFTAVSQQLQNISVVNVLHSWVRKTSSGVFQNQQSLDAPVL